MNEIRIHGRGGQGAVTFGEMIARAAFHDGREGQAFPFFGVERRGAPIMAFARIDDRYIRLKQQVYEPDAVVVLDSTLLDAVDVSEGLKKGGVVLVESQGGQAVKVRGAEKAKAKVFAVDAMTIALEEIGKPFANTPMLGAFAKATGLVSMNSLEASIREKFSGEIAEKNIRAMKRAYKECACL